MKSRKYWLRRAINDAHAWENRCRETIEQEVAAHYQQALRAIKGDILKLYANFAKDNGLDFGEAQQLLSGREFREWRMSMQEYLQRIASGDKGLERELNALAMRPRITRLEKLYAETLQELDKMGRDVDKSMRDFLAEAYKGNYAKNIFDLVKVGGLSVAMSKLDNIGVEKVLAARWSGKNFSQRIWTNTKLLGGVLKETVANGVHRGLSIQQMSRMVENKMQSGYGNAVRLVRTEMNYVNNQAHFDSMKDAGVAAYEFIAVLDNRTSTQCKTRDGETYLLEEKSVGFNYPPLHPRCRSTVAPFIEGVSKKGTRIAKDKSGKYIDIPSSMNYKDYESVYIRKEKSLETWKAEHNLIPRLKFVNYDDVAKPRTVKEFVEMGRELKPIAEKYVGRPSKWSGKINIFSRSRKEWDCSISLENKAPKHVLLHEMIHSCSASYSSQAIFRVHFYEEELVTQLLCQEISILEGIEIVASGYDEGVEILRDFKKALKIKKSDLEFAQDLIKQPLQERWNYLEGLISNALTEALTVEDYTKILEKLEAIKQWRIPKAKKS